LGEDHFLGREMNAIGHIFYNLLDPAVCIYECPFRVFEECQNLPKRLDLIGESPQFGAYPCEINTISPVELWRKLEEDSELCIIDVREPTEFQRGHIQGAELIPLPDILAEPSLIPKNKLVVLNCRSGRRSTRVAYELVQKGYNNLEVLEGGILAWEAAMLLEAYD
jgi:SulP family sulfate permease